MSASLLSKDTVCVCVFGKKEKILALNPTKTAVSAVPLLLLDQHWERKKPQCFGPSASAAVGQRSEFPANTVKTASLKGARESFIKAERWRGNLSLSPSHLQGTHPLVCQEWSDFLSALPIQPHFLCMLGPKSSASLAQLFPSQWSCPTQDLAAEDIQPSVLFLGSLACWKQRGASCLSMQPLTRWADLTAMKLSRCECWRGDAPFSGNRVLAVLCLLQGWKSRMLGQS